MIRWLGLAVVLGAAIAAPVASQSSPSGMHAIKMAVANPAKSVRFYEALGMKEGPKHGQVEWELGWAEAAHGPFIYLIHDPQNRVPMPKPGGSFVMIDVPDITAALSRLPQGGFSGLPEPRITPRAAILILADPDGNVVQVMAPVALEK